MTISARSGACMQSIATVHARQGFPCAVRLVETEAGVFRIRERKCDEGEDGAPGRRFKRHNFLVHDIDVLSTANRR
jgi:hypothetical protein